MNEEGKLYEVVLSVWQFNKKKCP